MNNVISYVEEFGEKTFEDMPFNEIDSLVLSQLSYLDFGEFVSGLDSYTIPIKMIDICTKDDNSSLYASYWYKEDNRKLFEAVSKSRRFEDLSLNFYVNIYNEEESVQFSAITYVIKGVGVYIAYRGTDATILGWKEDMELAFSEPIHAQELAVEYLNRVAGYISGDFYVGGHSKGGNLAVYAAMFTTEENQERILAVYDHDGPGFRPEICKKGNLDAIRNKIYKYIPRFSIVGILFEDDMDYDVVDCWSVGALQHNTYMWKSEGDSFIRAKDMPEIKKLHDSALNEWIYSMSKEELSLFIDIIYSVVTSADEVKTLFDLIDNPKRNILSAIETIKEIDDNTRDKLKDVIKRFVDILGENARSEVSAKIRKILSKDFSISLRKDEDKNEKNK